MDLRTVKHFIWKSGGDLTLHYRQKSTWKSPNSKQELCHLPTTTHLWHVVPQNPICVVQSCSNQWESSKRVRTWLRHRELMEAARRRLGVQTCFLDKLASVPVNFHLICFGFFFVKAPRLHLLVRLTLTVVVNCLSVLVHSKTRPCFTVTPHQFRSTFSSRWPRLWPHPSLSFHF